MSGNDFFNPNNQSLSQHKLSAVTQHPNYFPPNKKLSNLKLKKKNFKAQQIEPLIMVYGDPVEVHVKTNSTKITNSPVKRPQSVVKKEPLNIKLKLPKSSIDYNNWLSNGELPNLTHRE